MAQQIPKSYVGRLLAAKPLRVLEVAFLWGVFSVVIFDLSPHLIDYKVALVLWLMQTYTCWTLLAAYSALHEIMVTDAHVFRHLGPSLKALEEGKGPHVQAISKAVKRDVASMIDQYVEAAKLSTGVKAQDFTIPDAQTSWKQLVGAAPKEENENN